VEDGGSARYSATGHLLFARGDVLLAAPFDLQRAEVRGAPVSVWSGLSTRNRAIPALFRLTGQGTLAYRPGQTGWGRTAAILGADGKLQPWSAEQREFDYAMTLSPDGRRMVGSIINAQAIDQLWISPVEHDEFTRLGSESKADIYFPVWSPDGKQVAYARSGKDDRDGVYVQSVDGGEPRRILRIEAGDQDFFPYFPTAWLADNSALLLTYRAAGKLNLKLLPLGEKEADTSALKPFLPADFKRGFATLSRDGALLAFISEETGTEQVWVAEVRSNGETGRPIQIRTARVAWHNWGTDGKTLFIQDGRGRLLKATVNSEPTLSASAPVEVADLGKLGVQYWTPLPEGRFIVMLKTESESELKSYDLVLNWTELLKRKVPVAR
jgi:dipeptidyl aminopeptidase/acylaminoacyl peptidase